MAATGRSLRVTEAYRRRILTERQALQRRAEQLWPSIQELDRTDWPARMAAATSSRQATAVRLAGSYLTAYVASETGVKGSRVKIDPEAYVGLARDGRALSEALQSPIIGVLGQLKSGVGYQAALEAGLVRAKRLVGVEFDHAHRQALLDAMDAHPQIEGWTRAVAGTCGACAAVASGTKSGSLRFEAHPDCQCVSEPRVSDQRSSEHKAMTDRALGNNQPASLQAGRDLVSQEVKGNVGQAMRDVRSHLDLDDLPDLLKYTGLRDRGRYGARPQAEQGGVALWRSKGLGPDMPVRTIQLSREVSPLEAYTTFQHELAHFIDQGMIGSSAPARAGVLEAGKASESWKAITALSESSSPTVAKLGKYLAQDHELFARAFQQYMAGLGGKRGAKALELARERRGDAANAWFWSEEDFKPVAKAMEKYLREVGLLNG